MVLFNLSFPLYSKGKEKFQFNYGVYLMNKNIAQVRQSFCFELNISWFLANYLFSHLLFILSQLRYYCGLGTTDLRVTLPNLKSLLELRLGVKL